MISVHRLRNGLALVMLLLLLGLATLSLAAVITDSGPSPVKATVTESCGMFVKPADSDARPDELQILPRECRDR